MLESLLFSIFLLIAGYVARVLVRPPDKDLCPHCGYSLRGHARPTTCPECGVAERRVNATARG